MDNLEIQAILSILHRTEKKKTQRKKTPQKDKQNGHRKYRDEPKYPRMVRRQTVEVIIPIRIIRNLTSAILFFFINYTFIFLLCIVFDKCFKSMRVLFFLFFSNENINLYMFIMFLVFFLYFVFFFIIVLLQCGFQIVK